MAVVIQAVDDKERIDLLEKDIYIMLQEVRQLREHNEQLIRENHNLNLSLGRYRTKVVELNNKIAEYENQELGTAEEVGFYILQQRQSMGLSLAQFADVFHINRKAVSKFEMGKGNVKHARILAGRIQEFRRGNK
jgi:regulator of replication initiation timing